MTFLNPSRAHFLHSDVDATGTKVEYLVYTIAKSSSSFQNGDACANQPRWEMKFTTQHKGKAFDRARVLHRSHDYSSVEIMRKVCRDQDICFVDERYKVFRHKDGRRVSQTKAALFLFAALAGTIGLSLSLYSLVF